MASTTQIIERLNESFEDKRKKYSVTDLDLRLRQAAAEGDEQEVRDLLSSNNVVCDHATHGIKPTTNLPYSGKTALHFAAEFNRVSICELLLNHGWTTSKKDSQGNTAKEMTNEPRIIKLLSYYDVIAQMQVDLQNNISQLDLLTRLPQKGIKTLRVLSLACGEAIEFKVLSQLYPYINWEFVGVDNDKDFIGGVANRFRSLTNVSWHCLDATDKNCIEQEIPGRFDIVFIRHPNVLNMPEIFEPILTEILPLKVKSDGILFMSTYHKQEIDSSYKLIKDNFHSVTKNNYYKSAPGHNFSINGVSHNVDAHSVVLSPTPALQEQIALSDHENNEVRPGF